MGAAPSPQKLVTKQQYDAAIAGYSRGTHSPFDDSSDAEALQKFKDTMSVLPPPAPDLASNDVLRARQAYKRKLLMGGLTGPLDLTGGGTARLPGLSGT